MEPRARVEPQRPFPALAQIGVTALTLLCLALLDGTLAALREPRPPQSVALAFPVMAFARLPEGAGEALLFVLIAALVTAKAQRSASPELWVLGLSPAVIAVGVYCYEVLVTYEPFRGYWPFNLGLLAFAIALLGGSWVSSAHRFREHSYVPIFFHAALIAMGLVAYGLNYHFYRGLYPTLHHAALVASVTLVLSSGVLLSLRLIAPAYFFAYPIAAWAIAAALVYAGRFDNAETYFRYASELGQLVAGSSNRVFPPLSKREREAVVAPDSKAIERFAAESHYPVLPSEFRLEDYNVLLIAAEATRFDRTSLSEHGPGTTPNLAHAAADGFTADRAYSPSSGTLHSMSALFTMKYPAAIDLTSWMQSWFGELAEGETTVAELFAAAGYQTFWIGYNHRHVFEERIIGFKQGFQDVKLIDDEESEPVDGDAAVTSLAIEKLKVLGHPDSDSHDPARRFFGFIFFASPHQPYRAHGFPGMPSQTKEERYLQEIRNVDLQFGRVLEALSEAGLQRNTVVIFLSDHGEEFGEHGGWFHKTTLYSESVRVPLVILVPGLSAQRQLAPTSTLYLFPWLLSHSSLPQLFEPAQHALTTLIGPTLRETGGAVVAELSGHDRIKSTLIYSSKKLNYDHQSRLFELFEIENDPLEQNNVFPVTEHQDLLERFSRYYTIRNATKKYRFLPEKYVSE